MCPEIQIHPHAQTVLSYSIRLQNMLLKIIFEITRSTFQLIKVKGKIMFDLFTNENRRVYAL